jgi:DNA-binding MurR/RpiR family transcriptional regulator
MKASSTPGVVYESASPEVAFAQSEIGQSLKRVLADGSGSNRAIANFLLRNPVRVPALGIEELAESCTVSTATVSRFARDLGFANYAAMRNEVASTVQALLQPVDKLRNQIERKTRDLPATESLDYVAANVAATSQALSERDLKLAVQKLKRARTVYVLGFGLSSALADLLALHLQPFCRHVVCAAGAGGTEVAAGHLANITEADVLVVMSFPRYALDVVRLTGFARTRSATVIAITDAPASPLAELADIALFAQSTHPILPSSAAAALGLIEALVATLMVSNKENVEKAARLTEAISAYLYGAEPKTKKSK